MSTKYEKIIMVLIKVKSIINNPNIDITYSGYNSVEEIIKDIDSYIEKLNDEDASVIKDVKLLFAPTGTLQEISIDNKWSDTYMNLAELLDKIM